MERNQLLMKIGTQEACTFISLYSLNTNGRISLETVTRSGV
jgi:anti-sigma regulatory factor (Ser/Thr protein kinase)